MKTSSIKEEANIQPVSNSIQENVSKDKPEVGAKDAASTVKAKRPNYRRLL